MKIIIKYIIFFTCFILTQPALAFDEVDQFSYETLKEQHDAYIRVRKIFEKIAIANSNKCEDTQYSFGQNIFVPDYSLSKATQRNYEKAYGVKYRPSILLNSSSDNSANQIHAGDKVISINGTTLEGKNKDQQVSIIESAGYKKELRITTMHNKKIHKAVLKGQLSCNANIFVINSDVINATTFINNITITTNLIKTLKDDDELAFIIGHEFAHVIYKHASLENIPETINYETRHKMEKDADELGVYIIAKAGYDPYKAKSSMNHFYKANRFGINKVLFILGMEYNGPYMRSNQRIAFLEEIAKQVEKDRMSAPEPMCEH